MESAVTVEEVISHSKASSSGDEPAPNDSAVDYRYHSLLEERSQRGKRRGIEGGRDIEKERKRPKYLGFQMQPSATQMLHGLGKSSSFVVHLT